MKYIIILLSITSLSCHKNNNDVIISSKNREWYIETIEEHDFLYRKDNVNVGYIHRPNCKACKSTITEAKTEIIDTTITY